MDSDTTTKVENPILNLSLFQNLPKIENSIRTLEITPSADPVQQEREAQIKQYLGRQIRVQIRDGRIYQGGFWAYDNQGTVLLRHGSQVPSQEMTPSSTFVKPPTEHNVIHILQKDIVKVMASSTPFQPPSNPTATNKDVEGDL